MAASPSPTPTTPQQDSSLSSCLVELVGLPASYVPSIWQKVAPFIQKALAYQRQESLATIYDKLMSEDYQLWVAKDDEIRGVIVTLINEGVERVCVLLLAAGDWKACAHVRPEIERWAKEKGCTYVETYARPGFEKRLPGYRKTHIIMGRPL